MKKSTYLYSFIMEYDDGSYISQVEATNEREAMISWLENLDISTIDNFSLNDKIRLIEENFIEENPILISGCKNIWCFGLRIKKNKALALVNMIKTLK